MRKKKIVEMIQNNFTSHNLNGHFLRIENPVDPSITSLTTLKLNDAVLQIMKHLGLVYDSYTGKLVPSSVLSCNSERPKSAGKPVPTIEFIGIIHLATSGAHSKLAVTRSAEEITCPKCREMAKEKGFLQ